MLLNIAHSYIMVLHRSTELNILAFVTFLNILDVMHGYDFKCPQAVNWNVRSKKVCIGELAYVCLYDDVNKNTSESCKGPLPTIAKGYTWVVRRNPDRGKCSLSTYQPFKHSNSKSSDCVYQKSLCREEGQVVFDTGNTTDDQTCRCDYRRGYDFVVKPRNQCYCNPTKEDCSCFLRRCVKSETGLSQDYKCLDSYTTITVCPSIISVVDNGLQPKLFRRHKDVEIDWSKICITIVFVSAIVVSTLVLVVILRYQFLHTHIFLSPLISQKCWFGEDVKFECTLSIEERKSHWFKYKNKPELAFNGQPYSNCLKHALVIHNVSFDDEGLYSIKVRNDTSQAELTVEDKLLITSKDIHYILSVHAIGKIAIPAVRKFFDRKFHPYTLSDSILKHKHKLRPLLKEKHINSEQWKLLFHNLQPLSSKMFDLQLMVFLLKHIAKLEIVNGLPQDNDTSEVADLCRIDYYRNNIPHYDGRMSNTDFTHFLRDLMKASERLTGIKYECSAIGRKPKQLWNDHLYVSDELSRAVRALLGNESEEIQEMIGNISTEERNFLRIVYLLHRVGCPAVRYKFNQMFCPAKLEQILEKQRKTLVSLKHNKKITPSQWKSLFPDVGKTSSKDFGLELMLILICDLKPSSIKEETQALLSLESYLHTIASSTSGRVSDEYFDAYWNDICESIILLGGDAFSKRFKNICCFLRIESTVYLDTFEYGLTSQVATNVKTQFSRRHQFPKCCLCRI